MCRKSAVWPHSLSRWEENMMTMEVDIKRRIFRRLWGRPDGAGVERRRITVDVVRVCV